jgi:cold shock CspA family protein
MGRSRETYSKKEVQNKKDKKRKEKEKKRLVKKEQEKKSSLDDMIAYVDENGMITSTPPDPTKKQEVKLEDIQIGTPARKDDESYDPVRKGIVTFFNESKGYGFIRDMESRESIFVHANQLMEPIKEDNVVNFEVEKGLKGLSATKVRLFK